MSAESAITFRGLNPALVPYAQLAIEVANQFGIDPVVTSVYRSWSEQQTLRDRYLAGNSQYPAAAPGHSAHNYGLAFDSVVPPDQMPTWVAIRQALGWHVPSNDLIHAEYPGWKQLLGVS